MVRRMSEPFVRTLLYSLDYIVEGAAMTRAEKTHLEPILIDIRAGMPERDLMRKYRLTPRGLGALLKDLVNADLLSFPELIRRSTGQLNLLEVMAEFRSSPRDRVEFLLPISDMGRPENAGLVYDISGAGIGAKGLMADVGEQGTFVIPAEDYFYLDAVVFQGLCRWVERKIERMESRIGLEVTRVLQGDLGDLAQLIRALTSAKKAATSGKMEEARAHDRKPMEFGLPIIDSQNPEYPGLVCDISDDGVGTRGLSAQVGEIRIFVIPADDYFRSEPIVFKGICRWVEPGEDRWKNRAGFRVSKIFRGSLKGLQDIMKALNPEASDA